MFRKGQGGRGKGTLNKFTIEAKEAFQMAFDGIGGIPKLIEWANRNPSEFFKLYARLIPLTFNGTMDKTANLIIEMRNSNGISTDAERSTIVASSETGDSVH